MGTKELSDTLSYLPVTVVGFAALTGWLHASGIEYYPEGHAVVDLFHPAVYVGSLFFHANWAHYQGNIAVLLPFGLLLTWLTNNRHVLFVIVVSHFFATVFLVGSFLTVGVAMFGVGSSLAVYGVMGASVLAAAGYLRDTKGWNSVVGGALAFLTFVYIVTVFVHLGHAFGLLFGTVIESFHVFGGTDEDMESVGDEYTPTIRRYR
jgi:membrane associated rhomboid family serine protease